MNDYRRLHDSGVNQEYADAQQDLIASNAEAAARRKIEDQREQWAEKAERLREAAEKEIDEINLRVRLAVFAAAARIYAGRDMTPNGAVKIAWKIWREVRRGEDEGMKVLEPIGGADAE